MIHAKKSLGQHFLVCSWVAPTLIKVACVTPRDVVLEIGPGKGALTFGLAREAHRVVAIEKDEELAEALSADLKEKKLGNVTILVGDALHSLPEIHEPYKLVSNIPYYLTSRLIRDLLYRTSYMPKNIVLTVQKEVAQRIVARPPQMNLLGLAVSLRASAHIVKTVPASCFRPKPKVDSAIIAIEPFAKPPDRLAGIDPEKLLSIAKKAFQGKRKTIGNTLHLKKTGLPEAILKKRPQELSVDEWVMIYQTIA